MKKPTILKLVMAFALMSFMTGFSQDKPVTSLLKSYIDASNKLGETKIIDDITVLFDEKYKSNIAYVGMSGVIQRTTITYSQFSDQLAENVKNKNYNFTMSLGDVIHESQKERAGTVSAVVNFESKIDGKIAEKGTMLINLVASKIKGDWKITHNNTVRVSEESEIGSCVCYLFSKGKSFFNAETYYPAGVKYNREYKSYRVGVRDGERVIVNRGNDDKTYTWAENGDVLDGTRKIGSAESSDEAIRVVLSAVYGETCTKINFS